MGLIEYGQDISAKERIDQVFMKKDADRDGYLTETEYMDGMGEDHFLMRLLQSDQFRWWKDCLQSWLYFNDHTDNYLAVVNLYELLL